jgi:hypothetical protein
MVTEASSTRHLAATGRQIAKAAGLVLLGFLMLGVSGWGVLRCTTGIMPIRRCATGYLRHGHSLA